MEETGGGEEADIYIYSAFDITEGDLYDVGNNLIGKKYDADVYYFYTYGPTGTTSFTITDYQKIEQFDTYYYVSAGSTGAKFTVYEEPSTGVR